VPALPAHPAGAVANDDGRNNGARDAADDPPVGPSEWARRACLARGEVVAVHCPSAGERGPRDGASEGPEDTTTERADDAPRDDAPRDDAPRDEPSDEEWYEGSVCAVHRDALGRTTSADVLLADGAFLARVDAARVVSMAQVHATEGRGLSDGVAPRPPTGRPAATGTPSGHDTFLVERGIAARRPCELSLAAGSVVLVTRRRRSGWWTGVGPDRKRGVFPADRLAGVGRAAALSADRGAPDEFEECARASSTGTEIPAGVGGGCPPRGHTSGLCRHERFVRSLPSPRPRRVAVADTGRYGRGVFALTDFRFGEVVEVCPYIVDPGDTLAGRFLDYVWDEEGHSVLVFGLGSIFNHSDLPNVCWKYKDDTFDPNDPNEQFLVFFALRDVMRGEELLVDYGAGYWKTRQKQ
jgi:hypothetical protein